MKNERQVEFQTFKFHLDKKTVEGDYSDNRINQKILSLSFSDSSSPNAKLKVRFKEGDELILRPGRVVHLKQLSLGAIFTWDSQPSEWAVIEVSDQVYFPSSDYLSNTTIMSSGNPTYYRYREETYPYSTSAFKLISEDENRRWVEIHNISNGALRLGLSSDETMLSGTARYYSFSDIVVFPFTKIRIETNKALWAFNFSDILIRIKEAF